MIVQESLAFLNSLANFEKGLEPSDSVYFDPDRVKRMLKKTGLDYEKIKIIHIAGTKGKGSVSYFLAKLIQDSQKGNVGLYTSPHLFRINERIKVNFKDISDRELSSLITRYGRLVKRSRATYFDALTFLAMVYFISERCDYVILETGLGGRLDSTNFCKPVLSMITSIGYDHTNILGKSISQIAGEKAGIIKKNIPVLSARQDAEALKKIQAVATENKSRFFYFPELVKIKIKKRSRSGAAFDAVTWYQKIEKQWKGLKIFQIGDASPENYFLCVLAAMIAGINVSRTVLRKSLALQIPYRLQIIKNNLIDVSHNDQSIKLLFDTLIRYVKAKRYHLYITILSDKEINRIAKVIVDYRNLFHTITVFDFETYRKSGGKKLFNLIRRLPNAVYSKDITLLKPGKKEFNVFTGSFYAVEKVLELIK